MADTTALDTIRDFHSQQYNPHSVVLKGMPFLHPNPLFQLIN